MHNFDLQLYNMSQIYRYFRLWSMAFECESPGAYLCNMLSMRVLAIQAKPAIAGTLIYSMCLDQIYPQNITHMGICLYFRSFLMIISHRNTLSHFLHSSIACSLDTSFFIRSWFIGKRCSTVRKLRELSIGFLRQKKVDLG